MLKKAISILVVGLSLTTGLMSCTKEQSPKYKESSDFDENVKAVLTNEEDFENISYLELSEYSDSFQRYIFQHMSPASNARIWHEKIAYFNTEVFQDNLAVIDHLNSALPFITADIYVPEFEDDGTFEVFKDSWTSGLVSLIGYDSTRVFVSSLSIHLLTYFNPGDGGGANIYSNNCTCNIYSDYCPGVSKCKYRANDCTEKPKGCGFILMDNCNGKCR